MSVRWFGTLADGGEIEAITIRGGDLVAEVLTYGAVIRTLHFDGDDTPLVLGFDWLEDYLAHSPFFGAIAGRSANRIRDGRFELDGKTYQLETNFIGKHHLHGGTTTSFAKRPWRLADRDGSSVTLDLVSPAGEGGYPGRVHVACTYRIVPPATLEMTLTAETDAPTIVNLAHHSYFNLDGADDILDHQLMIAADSMTPVDAELLPTGRIAPVARTPYDFRKPRPVWRERDGDRVRYDINFVLADHRRKAPEFAARLETEAGRALEIWTTEPGLQFYDGARVDAPVAGLGGRRYGPSAGLCLEPQVYPDAPNHAHFPSSVLRPGETYRQVSEFRFEAG